MSKLKDKTKKVNQDYETVDFTANGFNIENLFSNEKKKGGFFRSLVKKDIKQIIYSCIFHFPHKLVSFLQLLYEHHLPRILALYPKL